MNGHILWVLDSADAEKVRWRCAACGVVVEFWRPGLGSTPTSTEDAPPSNVGAYSGRICDGEL